MDDHCRTNSRGTVDKLMKLIRALEAAGIEIIGEHAPSGGIGRGVRLRDTQCGTISGETGSMLYDQPRPKGGVAE